MIQRLAVYCGSASPADPRYLDLAREVGDLLARRGIGVVYGGGRLGLMGALASRGTASRGRSDRGHSRSDDRPRDRQSRLH